MSIVITPEKKQPKLKSPVLIEGLPGIGGVGKLAADFLVEELGAVAVATITSKRFPPVVFVNDKSLIDLPEIKLMYANAAGKDFLFLTGDIQPADEESTYDFCEELLNLLAREKAGLIITLGGIGLIDEPKKPRLFCTGNTKAAVQRITAETVCKDVHGVVGPILGVTGLLMGLAKHHCLDAVCLLAETYAHPAYLGTPGAKELIKALNAQFSLGINEKAIEEKLKGVEEETAKKAEEVQEAISSAKMQKVMSRETSYIG
ncbi:TPA: hypothetical protein HA361_04865 [Candidatus Woesearchaeota archaeon]|nr:hypothetical protein [Candidatus Woesearchaeota archaeon]HII68454.1 hypothetical protein [Candidatus Woesearchaeota archaeon]